jgi:hypothetical protein
VNSPTATYCLWKWADNDLPGRPNEVFAALMRGELHPALQRFDAQPLLARLEELSARRRELGEEWDWQVHPSDNPTKARFVFLTCPHLNGSEDRATSFADAMNGLEVSGYDEQFGHVIHVLDPKFNCFLFGQDHRERHYDITAEDLPALLRRIDREARDPFAVLEDRRHCFVQCCAHKRRFCVEWRENYDLNNWNDFAHWRAHDPRRSGAIREAVESRHGGPDHDTLTFADTVRIFQAFVQGNPKPSRYRWRDIKPLLERQDARRKEPEKAKRHRRKAASHD